MSHQARSRMLEMYHRHWSLLGYLIRGLLINLFILQEMGKRS